MDPNAILPLSGDRQAAAEAKRGVVEGTDAKGGVVSVVERSRLGAPAWQPSNVATSTKPVRVRLKLRLLVLQPNGPRFCCGRLARWRGGRSDGARCVSGAQPQVPSKRARPPAANAGYAASRPSLAQSFNESALVPLLPHFNDPAVRDSKHVQHRPLEPALGGSNLLGTASQLRNRSLMRAGPSGVSNDVIASRNDIGCHHGEIRKSPAKSPRARFVLGWS